jgi:hypothetical protein
MAVPFLDDGATIGASGRDRVHFLTFLTFREKDHARFGT